jgi:putative ATP-dependent endonuclease of the OLD family
MHIDQITIKNFRSLKETSLTVSTFSVLLGANNSGKSNILRALEFFLTPSMQFNPDDYPAGVFPFQPVEIEVSFRNLTATEAAAFQSQLRGNGILVLKRIATVGNDHPQNNGYRWIASDGTVSDLPADLITPGKLPEFFFVPALFDIRKELTVNSNTYFGRLLKRFIATSPLLLDLGRTLAEQEYALNTRDAFGRGTGLSMLERKLDEDLSFFNGKIKITAPQLSVEQLYELGTTVSIDDGVSTDVLRKGHGLQRALVFAFIRQWVKALANQPNVAFLPEPNRSGSVIFAIEEPELNIHPHGLRKIVSDLNELAATANHQVIVCSHSSYFVDLSKPETIAVVRKSTVEQGTKVSQCAGVLFPGTDKEDAVKRFNATAYFNPDRSELFFADRIILVEGQTEAKLLPYLAHLLGVYRPGCSIIDCDGKYNLRLYMEVLNRFGLSYVVIHDEDPLPQPPDEPSNAQRGIFNENSRIAILAQTNPSSLVLISQPGFETIAQIEVEPNKPFSAYENFKNRTPEQIPHELKDLVRRAFGADAQ